MLYFDYYKFDLEHLLLSWARGLQSHYLAYCSLGSETGSGFYSSAVYFDLLVIFNERCVTKVGPLLCAGVKGSDVAPPQ